MSHSIKKYLLRTCKTFSGINVTNIFLDQSPKAIEMKTKINKLYIYNYICNIYVIYNYIYVYVYMCIYI